MLWTFYCFGMMNPCPEFVRTFMLHSLLISWCCSCVRRVMSATSSAPWKCMLRNSLDKAGTETRVLER
jgi:hypothetical protein